MATKPLNSEEKESFEKMRKEYIRPVIFYSKRREQTKDTCFWNEEENKPYGSGWYYWFSAPGCLPEGNPMGPFTCETAAIRDCLNNFAD